MDYYKFDCVSHIVQMFQFIFDTYVSVFLIFVIYKFSADDETEEVHDMILGKKVHAVVFIKNQKLLQDAIKNELTLTDENEKALRLNAQMNEHMHYMLKKEGIVLKMDETITVSFISRPTQVVPLIRSQSDVRFTVESIENIETTTVDSEKVSSLLVQDILKKARIEMRMKSGSIGTHGIMSTSVHSIQEELEVEEETYQLLR